MPYIITVTVDYAYVAPGAGPALTGQNQANEPGFTSSLTPGPVPIAQALRMMVNEAVPGGESPSGANFNTALSSAATDLGTLLAATGGAPGYTSGTALATVQGWATGNP